MKMYDNCIVKIDGLANRVELICTSQNYGKPSVLKHLPRRVRICIIFFNSLQNTGKNKTIPSVQSFSFVILLRYIIPLFIHFATVAVLTGDWV